RWVATIVQIRDVGGTEGQRCQDVVHVARAGAHVAVGGTHVEDGTVVGRQRLGRGQNVDVEESVLEQTEFALGVGCADVEVGELAPVAQGGRPEGGGRVVDRDVVVVVGGDLQYAEAIHKGGDGGHLARLQRFEPEPHAGRAAARGRPGLLRKQLL